MDEAQPNGESATVDKDTQAQIDAHESGYHVGADTYFGDACPLCRVTSPAHHTIPGEDPQERVLRLMDEAYAIVAEAIQTHITSKGKRLAGECVLFSGGNDSTVLAHLFRDSADYAVHANTTIGIEATRQFVRDTCMAWDLPLREEFGESYRALVVAQGFPGPAHHFKMYQRLKERALRKVRNSLIEHNRRERVVFIAGRRRQESERRKDVPKHERDGSTVWASPLVSWTDDDMATYRRMYPDVPRNPVAEHLHMSGECLCGAFAKPGEREMIGFFYPEWEAEITALEAEVRAAGHPPDRCVWGWGADKGRRRADAKRLGPLCSSCTLWTDDELDVLTVGSVDSREDHDAS